MHDLVVVGAGPSGSRLAAEAAGRGHDALVLEKGRVGEPLACSGHLSGDVWDFLPDDADHLLQNEIRGARFHVDGESYEFYKDEPVSYALDRVEMDRVLAREAEREGARVRENAEVVGVECRDSYAVVEMSGGNEVRAGLVAGCDGPQSTVRREAGLGEPDDFLQGFLAFSDEVDSSDFVDVYLDVPDFFGWRIPRGDSVEYGAACRRGVREKFDEVVSPDAELTRYCAGLIPVGPPSRTVRDRVFLVGDAAAQVKPFTGGGIVYGMTAADIAASMLDPGDPSSLREYEREWRRELGREIRLGGLLRRGYTAPKPVQRLGLAAFEGRINVHMDRPSTLFNRETAKRVFGNLFG